MRAKVLKRFIDRETLQPKEVGRVYAFDEERVKVLAGKGFVEVVQEKKTETTKKKTTKGGKKTTAPAAAEPDQKATE